MPSPRRTRAAAVVGPGRGAGTEPMNIALVQLILASVIYAVGGLAMKLSGRLTHPLPTTMLFALFMLGATLQTLGAAPCRPQRRIHYGAGDGSAGGISPEYAFAARALVAFALGDRKRRCALKQTINVSITSDRVPDFHKV
jgi:hypothetical protein